MFNIFLNLRFFFFFLKNKFSRELYIENCMRVLDEFSNLQNKFLNENILFYIFSLFLNIHSYLVTK